MLSLHKKNQPDMQPRLFFMLMLALWGATSLTAQQQKQFTLDELIPGGKAHDQYHPQIPAQYQWKGNNLIMIQNDSVWISPQPGHFLKQSLLLTFKEIQLKTKHPESPISQLIFSPDGSDEIQFHTADGIGLFDINSREIPAFFNYPAESEHHILSPGNNLLAYTRENNLYLLDKNGKERAISNDSNKEIIYGQAVHRNEFGINRGIFWSPRGEKLAFYRMDETMVTGYPLVNMSTGVAEAKLMKYPMAGMKSHEVTVGIYDTATAEIIYLQTEPGDHYLTNIAWSPDGEYVYVAELNREQNHMQLNRYSATTGERDKTLFEEKHPKYVEPENPVLFVKNRDDQLIWQSRRDGFNHLYLYDTSGKLLRQLTRGDREVTGVIGFDEKGENLFFISTQPVPMERHIYSVTLKNGKIRRHTSLSGIHRGSVSLSGRYLLDRHTAHDNPGRLDLIDIHTADNTVLASATDPFKQYTMPSVEMGTLKAADGETDLYYRLVKPADFDAAKKYPVVVYVYGGPHSQMVNNRWRYGTGGWEIYMAQKGYLVFVMDNRGTAYRGMDFEQVTHRRLGVTEAEDQMKGVAFLQSLPYVDSERIGIHGWSYGGFMTINMLLRYPDAFRVGVAGGPVTDWKYYEVMYGERYMDTPLENPEGYTESSLLNKADQLRSRLLIIHGDEDPTVVPQHSVQFLKACIEAGTHPDLFIYPGHGHNILGQDRVHLHEHITRYFENFIPSDEE